MASKKNSTNQHDQKPKQANVTEFNAQAKIKEIQESEYLNKIQNNNQLVNLNIGYVGDVVKIPERKIKVQDVNGEELNEYDMYIYRCTNPGSQFDEVFSFKNQKNSTFNLESKTVRQSKKSGGIWLAPDFYISNEPKTYWVACVSKDGYQDRRWSLAESQGSPLMIKLKQSNARGSDICHTEKSECNACRSYEYFMYEPMRYRHVACDENNL